MKYNLTHLAQSGFRKFHCCETALAKMVTQWSTNVNKGDLTGLILPDLHKAFDMVNHDLLLRKLKQYRASDNALCWFTSNLTDRKQNMFKSIKTNLNQRLLHRVSHKSPSWDPCCLSYT